MRGSCSVCWVPSSAVVVVVTGVVLPTPRTVTRSRSIWVRDCPRLGRSVGGRGAGRVETPVTKIATSEPGLTKPATRSGSVRLIEMAILFAGMPSGEAASAALAPNLSATICSPDQQVLEGDGALQGVGAGLHVGQELAARDARGDDLAGGKGVVVALARGDGLAGGEDLDGVHAVLRASVGAADVEEDEESAHGGDDGGDDEEDPAAIHRR